MSASRLVQESFYNRTCWTLTGYRSLHPRDRILKVCYLGLTRKVTNVKQACDTNNKFKRYPFCERLLFEGRHWHYELVLVLPMKPMTDQNTALVHPSALPKLSALCSIQPHYQWCIPKTQHFALQQRIATLYCYCDTSIYIVLNF